MIQAALKKNKKIEHHLQIEKVNKRKEKRVGIDFKGTQRNYYKWWWWFFIAIFEAIDVANNFIRRLIKKSFNKAYFKK